MTKINGEAAISGQSGWVNASRLSKLCCFALLYTRLASAGDLRIVVAEDRGELRISNGDKPVLVYAFATNQFKPYVRELYAANGLNVLLDGPADHLHHHGLMYAVRVNGVNFWEENGEPGHEVPIKLLSSGTAATQEGAIARFTQLIHWVAHTNVALARNPASAMLIEERTIAVTVNGDELAVDWMGAFQVGTRAVEAHGSGYNGLGMRFPRSFDHVAQRQNSDHAPYSAAASWDVISARWNAMTGNSAGKEATVALFASARNAGQARFFSMLNPFAYSAVTQNLDKQPLRYAAGERFEVRHLVTVYPGAKTSDFLNQRFERWAKSVQPIP